MRNFIIPLVNGQGASAYTAEIVKGRIFGYPYLCLLPSQENEFWTILANQVDVCNLYQLDYKIYQKVRSMLKTNEISFYIAFKYLWNRLVFFNSGPIRSDGARSVYMVSHISIRNYCSTISFSDIDPNMIILGSTVFKIPPVLWPNLVYIIFNSFRNSSTQSPEVDQAMKGSYGALLKHPYPEQLTIQEPNKNVSESMSLRREYLDRRNNKDGQNNDDSVVTKSLVLGLLKRANDKEIKDARLFIEKIKNLECVK